MSNLLKRGSTVSKEERVIDYNEIIKAKLQNIVESNDKSNVDADGFVHGLTADVVEQLVTDPDEEGAASAETVSQEQMMAQTSEANEEADKIIASAHEQADEIIKNAEESAQKTYNQANEQGYNDGMQKASEEIEQSRKQLEDEYTQRFNQLESEYIEKNNNIEPQLVDVITEVFKSVISSEAVDNHDILMYLIDKALSGADRNHEYIIKVSPADYDYVSSNQGKISCHVNKEIDIEVQEDVSLEQNQCIIETDGAVFDCSLDVEMDNLIKKIKMLSCMK